MFKLFQNPIRFMRLGYFQSWKWMLSLCHFWKFGKTSPQRKKIWKEAPGKIVWRRKSMNKLTRAFLNLMAPGLIIRITRIGIKPKICSVLFWNIHKKIIWKFCKSFFWKKEESRKFQMYLYFPLSFLFLFYLLNLFQLNPNFLC